jgi:hypothetical protein
MADTTDRQRQLIDQIVAESQELQTLFAEAHPPPEPTPPPVTLPPVSTMAAFDAALANATAGATIVVSTSLVYSKPLTIRRPDVVIMSETYDARAGQRMTRDEPAPTFTDGITVLADTVTCSGLDVRRTDPTKDIVVLGASHLMMDRMRVLGSQTDGAKRGIAANGGDMVIRNCFIDEIKRKGQDTQAICAWDMIEPGLVIENCYLAGAGQAVMLGGADPQSAPRTPSAVRIGHSTLTKPAGWQTDGTQVKCAFEAKNCMDVVITDCDLIGAGTAQGQGAYAIVLTPRNQGGTAPYSTVTKLRIEACYVKSAGGVVTLLGTDPTAGRPSEWLDIVTIKNVYCSDIDPKIYGGPGRLFTFEDGAKSVTLDSLTVAGTNIMALGYFMKRPPTGLVLRNLKLPLSKYSWKIDGGGNGIPALQAYAPDAVIELSTTDTGSSLPPA